MENPIHYTYDSAGCLATRTWARQVSNQNLVTTYSYDARGGYETEYDYDAVGNTTASSGTWADANPFRFSTKYFDGETSLYYYGLRYYTPRLGRWASRDPIGERGGLNIYEFVHNRSADRIDTLGLRGWPWTGCCKGTDYNMITHCCRGDVIWSRFTTISTGVKKCTARAHSYGFVDHEWLETPSGAIDVVADATAPVDGIFGSTGVIGNASSYVSGTKSCTEVKVSPCLYDKDKFLTELDSLVRSYRSGATTWWYVVGLHDCVSFVEALVMRSEILSAN